MLRQIINSLIASPSVTDGLTGIGDDLTTTFEDVMRIVMPIVFAIVTILGVAYSVVLGVNYAKAEDSDKREEAKKRLTGAVIGFGIAIIASALIWILATTINWSDIFA